jgi:hypothetical protein
VISVVFIKFLVILRRFLAILNLFTHNTPKDVGGSGSTRIVFSKMMISITIKRESIITVNLTRII